MPQSPQFLAFRLLRGGFLAPVSGGDFPISVSVERRLVRLLTETGSVAMPTRMFSLFPSSTVTFGTSNGCSILLRWLTHRSGRRRTRSKAAQPGNALWLAARLLFPPKLPPNMLSRSTRSESLTPAAVELLLRPIMDTGNAHRCQLNGGVESQTAAGALKLRS